MKYSLDFLPEAEYDVQEIYDWYELQLAGLGEDFLLSVDAALAGISRNPLTNEILYKGVRKAKTKRFPFGVFYIIDKNIITVIAIVHLSRHPRTWKKRVRKRNK
ncbi:MAG TPA: type II toxin-antitoxin system RelE/ParE family toxin [Chitinophagales bacterium]|nr:type II toxin-antitoxin system RelE/ParE family toxin [Chitinophagales bacterium]